MTFIDTQTLSLAYPLAVLAAAFIASIAVKRGW